MSGQYELDSEQCEVISNMLEDMGIDYKNEEVKIHISEKEESYELEDTVSEPACTVNMYVQVN